MKNPTNRTIRTKGKCKVCGRTRSKLLDSDIADICNVPNTRLGGAITAALFLQEFVGKDIPWLHFDFMGFNLTNQPGRPKGGDAKGLRAIFNYLLEKFKS